MADDINRQLQRIAELDIRSLPKDRLSKLLKEVVQLIQKSFALWRLSFESREHVDRAMFAESFRLCFKCATLCLKSFRNHQGELNDFNSFENTIVIILWKFSELEFMNRSEVSTLWPLEISWYISRFYENCNSYSVLKHLFATDICPLNLFTIAYAIEVVSDAEIRSNIPDIIKLYLKSIDYVENGWNNGSDIQVLKSHQFRFLNALTRSLAARKFERLHDFDVVISKTIKFYSKIIRDLINHQEVDGNLIVLFLSTVSNLLLYVAKEEIFNPATFLEFNKLFDCIIELFVKHAKIKDYLYPLLKKCIGLFSKTNYSDIKMTELLANVEIMKLGKRHFWKLCDLSLGLLHNNSMENFNLTYDYLIIVFKNTRPFITDEDFPNWKRFLNNLCDYFPEKLILNQSFKELIGLSFKYEWSEISHDGRIALSSINTLSKKSNWRLYFSQSFEIYTKITETLGNMIASVSIDIGSYMTIIDIVYNFRHDHSFISDISVDFPKLIRNTILIIFGQIKNQKENMVDICSALNLVLTQFMDYQDFLCQIVADPIFILLISKVTVTILFNPKTKEGETQLCLWKMYRRIHRSSEFRYHSQLLYFSVKPFVQFSRTNRKNWNLLSSYIDIIKRLCKQSFADGHTGSNQIVLDILDGKYDFESTLASCCSQLQIRELIGLTEAAKFESSICNLRQDSSETQTVASRNDTESIRIIVTDEENKSAVFQIAKESLIRRSEYWYAMFKHGYEEGRTNEVRLKGSLIMFQVYFDYVTDEKVPILQKENVVVILELLEFSDSILERKLYDKCIDWLCSAVLDSSITNCVHDIIEIMNVLTQEEDKGDMTVENLVKICKILINLFGFDTDAH